ncbi:MAG TPA: hypothetical protein VEY07_08315 [Thermoplasmata archaeon]|nr:hypothetical protein [Thermoplasmata archaeon]
MTPGERRELVSTWHGTYVMEGRSVPGSASPPRDVDALARRMRERLDGRLTDEDRAMAGRFGSEGLSAADRRFESLGFSPALGSAPVRIPLPSGFSLALHREVVLAVAAQSLRAAWDPSIHVEEAVRAGADLDRVLNLIAERLTSWTGRDAIATEVESSDDPERVARSLVEGSVATSNELPPVDPALLDARRSLARLYLEGRTTREALEKAVAATLPLRAPNLSALLGPELAARLISLAGGLDRLARLPASTVQVLGAERAFFEHLRGHGSSPRHGVLFLHPQIQSARRLARGKLARALAGKAAIAARLDLGGAPVRPELSAAFEARSRAIRSEPARRGPGERRRPSRLPLDGAAEDR